MAIRFGTDGWRATIAEDFTFDNVRLCAQAVANYLLSRKISHQGLVIGYDTRFASENFAAATAEVVAANGIKVYLCDRASPTPVVSYSILTKGAAGAVVITASHNPWTDNGFKYKPEYAGSASPEVIVELEKQIGFLEAGEGNIHRSQMADCLQQGSVEMFDPTPPYVKRMRELVDVDSIRDAGLRVAVDSMHGAGAGYFRMLLEGGRTEVWEIRSERNPFFGGSSPEPIGRNLAPLTDAMRAGRFHVGLATDGDADRLGIVDEKGNFINQLQVFALLALYLLEVRRERGDLVKSITTTAMLFRLGEIYGVPVHETPVGFKYIGPKMMAVDALIGGEESGGYGFRGHIPERDAILAGLYFLDLIIKLGKAPSLLLEFLYSKVGPHYYDRIDIHFPSERREALVSTLTALEPEAIDNTRVVAKDARDGFRFIMEDGSWLLIRFSGTEPVLRIYTETNSIERVPRILAEGRRWVGV